MSTIYKSTDQQASLLLRAASWNFIINSTLGFCTSKALSSCLLRLNLTSSPKCIAMTERFSKRCWWVSLWVQQTRIKKNVRKDGLDPPIVIDIRVTSQVQILERVSTWEGPGLSVMGDLSAYRVCSWNLGHLPAKAPKGTFCCSGCTQEKIRGEAREGFEGWYRIQHPAVPTS